VGGSSKKQTVGYKYYLGMHMILSHGPIDLVKWFKVDDRIAWDGASSGGRIDVNSPSLFGGDEREGGITGPVDIEMGITTQGRNDYLISQLGSDIPAYRGVVGAVLRQCYLGNNQYLKAWSFRAQRVHVRQDGLSQWYDEKSAIPYDYVPAYPLIDTASWKYLTQSLGASGDYSSPSFDDSSWPTARLPFGDTYNAQAAENGFRGTPNHIVGLNTQSWLRRKVYLKSVPGSLSVRAYVDNGVTVWVNGVQVHTDYGVFGHSLQFTIPGSVLQVGENVIVIKVIDDVAMEPGVDKTFFDFRWFGTQIDMNPAHIIRECLTDPDWGMGYQDADIDDDSFTVAADTLFAERMGISLLWDRQTPLESFVGEIVKHIDAALYVSRTTGKFVLKLIRKDYDEETLIHLDESNVVKVDNSTKPTFGELNNSVTVNYWNAETGKDASVTVTDTAMVQMQGAVINTTVQYPGFSNAPIATIVAQRDLRSLSSPLLSCTIYAGQTAKDLNIGDTFKFSWSRWNVDSLVMRVTGIAFGDGKTNQVRIICTQDVFDTPSVSVIANPGTGWVDPSAPPSAPSRHLSVEAPYYEAVQAQGQVDVDDRLASRPELGYVIGIAARPGNAINARLYVNSGAAYEEAAMLDFSPSAKLALAVGLMTTVFSIEDFTDIDLVEVGTHVQIGDELCRVDAIDASAGTVTVGRGVLDTVPHAHDADAILYFWDQYAAADQTEYVLGETLLTKVAPITGQGALDLALATEDSVVMAQRAWRPYAPGKFQINGQYYPEEVTGSSITFTWCHRDRKQQTSGTLYDTTYGNIGPEAGVTYNLRIYDDENNIVENQTGISGTSYTWTNPAPAGGTELNPVQMDFAKVIDSDYFNPLPASLIDHTETYTTDTGQVTHYTLNTAGSYGISGGKFQVTYPNNATDKTDIGAINTASLPMPVLWVEAEVSITGTATGYSNGGVGIVKDAGNFVMAVAQQTQSAVRIEARFAGGSTSFLANVSKTIPANFKIALAMVVDSFTIYMDTGSGWQYVTGTGISTATYDFRTVGNLTGWNPGTFSASKGGAVAWAFDNLKLGRHGGVGMRDQTIVTNEDGSPYRPTADTVLFTATLPDARGQAYAGVFSLDLTDYSYEQVGAIMVERGGKVYNDLVPHIIYYPSGDRRILIVTWGNGFGGAIDVLHKLETSQELLSGTRIVSGMTQLSLPQSGSSPGTYDPMMVYDSANSRWLIAYSMTHRTDFSGSPFYAAAAYSTDLITWASIGTDTSSGYEGTKILKVGSGYWIMAGGPAGAGTSSRVFDSSMVYQGTLDALFEGGVDTQPHPMIFPYGSKQVMISFDNTKHGSGNFTWGNFLVYESNRYAPASTTYRVELESERDGVTSFQKHNWTFVAN